MSIDLVAGVALVLAVVIAMHVAQQYAAIAYAYRRCSQLTIGKWATRTHRRWVWKEIRFETTFSTPRISCAPPCTDFEPLPPPDFEPEKSPASNHTATVRSPSLTSEPGMKDGHVALDRQYRFVDAPKPTRIRAENNPRDDDRWYLDGQEAIPQAKCSWLTLLEDTTRTDARFTIREILNSYDLMPSGVTKPLASVEKRSFLTLMSLFGVKWNNRGEDKLLKGAGDFCEIKSQVTSDSQEIYAYFSRQKVNDLTGQPFPTTLKYYLISERARKAMFHCFDLGFATFLTHSDAEIKNSMEKSSPALDTDVIDRVSAFYRGSNHWCPGLSESITCWAAQSMPKVVEKRPDTFKSMFSAISAISMTTGKPIFVRMLLGNDSDDRCQIPDIKTLTGWAREYLCEIPNVKALLLERLRYAAESDVYQNISDREIPWTVSCRCLKAVQILDYDLDNRLLRSFEDDQKRNIKKSISNQQIKYGSSLYSDASTAAKAAGSGSWTQELDRVGARNYIEVAKYITEEFNNDPAFAQTVSVDIINKCGQMIVVNRLMRGALWVIHNGNAPNQAERFLECSLSSSWLSDTSTVLIT